MSDGSKTLDEEVGKLRRLSEARSRVQDATDLKVYTMYLPESEVWLAFAERDDQPDIDTGPAKPLDPAAAFAALAMELYREVIALRHTLFGSEGR